MRGVLQHTTEVTTSDSSDTQSSTRADKTGYWILAVPLFFFVALTLTLQYGSLVVLFPESDSTPYLAAASIAHDFDLAYSRSDSDRYFRRQLVRPSRFRVVQKKIISNTGEYRSYAAFYAPDLHSFVLAPLVRLLGYQGILLFHTLLMGAIYWIGFRYYGRDGAGTLPAVNALVFYTLIPLPVLFLMPSHHLWLFALVTWALYFGLRGNALFSALLLGVAFSSSVWAVLLGLLLISYWQLQNREAAGSQSLKFLVILAIAMLGTWGVERLMYPAGTLSEVRIVPEPHEKTLAEIWNTLPVYKQFFFGGFNGQQVIDFLFGRTAGFFVYGFAAGATLLTAIWLVRDALARLAVVFTLLSLIAIAVLHPTTWNVMNFASDPALVLAALAFFVCPVVKPKPHFILITALSCITAGSLLVNPAGAILNRPYYLHSFPFRLFPTELSLVGRAGLTADSDFVVSRPGAKLHLLNENFYREDDFAWVHGESSLEILLEQKSSDTVSQIQIRNGPLDNHVTATIGGHKKELWLHPGEFAMLEMKPFTSAGRWMEGRFFLHGTIQSESGFVPKLLSRDNPDYRFLGCQVHLITSGQTLK